MPWLSFRVWNRLLVNAYPAPLKVSLSELIWQCRGESCKLTWMKFSSTAGAGTGLPVRRFCSRRKARALKLYCSSRRRSGAVEIGFCCLYLCCCRKIIVYSSRLLRFPWAWLYRDLPRARAGGTFWEEQIRRLGERILIASSKEDLSIVAPLSWSEVNIHPNYVLL